MMGRGDDNEEGGGKKGKGKGVVRGGFGNIRA